MLFRSSDKILELTNCNPKNLNYIRWNECQSPEVIREKAFKLIDCHKRVDEINKKREELQEQAEEIWKDYYKFQKEAQALGISREVTRIVDDEYYSHLEDDD